MPGDKPKLKAGVLATPFETSGGERLVYLRDPAQPKQTLSLPTRLFYVASLFDGENDIAAVCRAYEERFGEPLLAATAQDVARRLGAAGMTE